MSLLLDALKRAEEDSRKRKLAAAGQASAPQAPPVLAAVALPEATPLQSAAELPGDAAKTELTLQAQTHASASPAQAPGLSRQEPPGTQLPAATRFPDLVIAPAEAPAPPPAMPSAPKVPNPGADLPSYARYAKPDSAGTAQAASPIHTGSRLRPPPAGELTVETLDLAAPMRATTQRQALSAAGALAGPKAKKAIGSAQRRQWLLAAVALLLALPLAALLLFGDQFFGSSSTLVAVNAPRAITSPGNPNPPAPVATPVSAPEVSASGSVTPAPPVATEVLASVAAPAPVSMLPRQVPAAPAKASQEPRAALRQSPVQAAPSREAAAKRAEGANGRPAPDTAGDNAAPVSLLAGAAKPTLGMEQAYAAYQSGKLDEASQLYREVLQADPTQRDAWLGLAVIAHGKNQRQAATDAYRRVLRLEPQNATALAGLSSLSSNTGASEPRQESKLRELLARSPQEAELNHALGLVLSGERRWSEAQPLFFKAHALAPQEPQFAYNLAVALDHLRKSSLALQYYETALNLARGKAPGFDEASARERLSALKTNLSGDAAQ